MKTLRYLDNLSALSGHTADVRERSGLPIFCKTTGQRVVMAIRHSERVMAQRAEAAVATNSVQEMAGVPLEAVIHAMVRLEERRAALKIKE